MAIDVVAEEIATNLEEAAEVTRKLSAYPAGFFFVGVAVGAVCGAYFVHKRLKEKLRMEAFADSQAEVERIREEYRRRTVASEPKPRVEDIVREKGYAGTEPVLTPTPSMIVEAGDGWSWDLEVAARTEEEPYVIHLREFEEGKDGYSRVNYTYYERDDVMTDEDDRPLQNANMIVGENNLKFGHGTEDPDTVFVRNDRLGVDMEITRHHGSFEEEVLGLDSHEDQAS